MSTEPLAAIRLHSHEDQSGCVGARPRSWRSHRHSDTDDTAIVHLKYRQPSFYVVLEHVLGDLSYQSVSHVYAVLLVRTGARR